MNSNSRLLRIPLLLFCITLMLNGVVAQSHSLGPILKAKQLIPLSEVLAYKNNFSYAVRSKFKMGKYAGFILEKYNDKHNLIFSKFNALDRPKEFNSFLNFQNKMYVCYRIKNSANKELEYYLQPISEKTGLLESKKIKVGSHPIHRSNRGDILRAPSSDDLTGYLKTIKSPDENLVAAITREQHLMGFWSSDAHIHAPINSFDNNTFSVQIFDSAMDELWNKRIKIPFKSEFINILEFKLDNYGNLHLLVKHRNEDWESLKKQKKPYYKYKTLTFKKDQIAPTISEIDFGDKVSSQITIESNNQTELICLGLYYEPGDKKKVQKGYFLFKQSPEHNKMEKVKIHEFSEDQNNLIDSQKKYAFSENKLKDVIWKSDGGIFFITEKYGSVAGGGTTGIGCGPIHVYCLSPTGEMEWVKSLYKNQMANTSRYISHALIHNKDTDDLFFVYNDNVLKKSDVKLSHISKDGNADTKVLFNIGKEKFRLRPFDSKLMEGQNLLIYGELNLDYRFGTISF